jgi:GcrA cell cycle regulator
MAWTDERVDILKKLWAEGLSASQIANRLGGVTRNAVIGKVHRLGLSGRTTTTRTTPSRPRRRAAPKQAVRSGGGGGARRTQGNLALKAYYEADPDAEVERAPAPVHELVIPVDERASILTLKESTCRWPIGDPGDNDFHFCGRHSDPSTPYCEFHSRVAYQPPQSRRRNKAAAAR